MSVVEEKVQGLGASGAQSKSHLSIFDRNDKKFNKLDVQKNVR